MPQRRNPTPAPIDAPEAQNPQVKLPDGRCFDVLDSNGKNWVLWSINLKRQMTHLKIDHTIDPAFTLPANAPQAPAHRVANATLIFINRHLPTDLQIQYRNILNPATLYNNKNPTKRHWHS